MLIMLGMGFLLGMRHALEADHAAAVAALATKSQSVGATIKQGLTWGLGHAITLLLFGSMVFLMETVVPERLANGLELAVGIMLLGLGLDVLHKMTKARVHFHVHQHANQALHVHAHSHKREAGHHDADHEHAHSTKFPYRALFVGFMHGMAGSAALILLTLQQTISLFHGIMYIALFGLGSMIGMGVLSIVIALPLRYSPGLTSRLHNGLQGLIGGVTILLGVIVIYTTGSSFLN